MGVDIYGTVKDECDKENTPYFRNNWWWWRPLWEYVCLNCPEIITTKQQKSGHYNCGALLDKNQSKAIAEKMQDIVDSGSAKIFENVYKSGRSSINLDPKSYPFSVKNLENFIDFLKKSNGISIY